MCGIAGVYGNSCGDAVQRMVHSLRTRGPNDQGIWQGPEVTLGHTRLAILDLSLAGHQPMADASGRLHAVFNGEIYNFRELRDSLQQRGYRFRSQCDTEVLVNAYHAWGPACVLRLTGMFAFGIFDAAPPEGQPTLFLARDRLGIKPLLYSHQKDTLWFASELRALRAAGLDSELDAEALLDYVAVGSVYQPRTLLAQVQALPAGHSLHVYPGTPPRLQRYWDLHADTASLRASLRGIDAPQARQQVRTALEEATQKHLMADVPVGAFLSGGIDSTAVVALMAHASGKPVQTFAVGFDPDLATLDERPFARRAAQALGTEHHEVVVGRAEAAGLFEEVLGAIDQPSMDGTNTYVVSRAARRCVTVALSGLGGDELFAGYDHFRWLAALASHPGSRTRTWRQVGEAVMRARPNALTWRALLRQASPAGRLAMLRRLVADHAMTQVVQPAWIGRFRSRLHDRHARWVQTDMDSVQQTSYAEVLGYLQSTLLRDVDVMSMAHSLEVRPVLLHHPLVELAYALPAHHKLRGRSTKVVLVEALHALLPAEVRNRRKRGFEMPLVAWMAGPLRARMRHLLHTEAAKNLFTREYLRHTEARLQVGKPPRALWAWAVLLGWLERESLSL